MSYKKTIKETWIYRGFFDFKEDELVDEKGNKHSYCTLHTNADGVVVLAEVEPNTFLFILEYRYPIKKSILCCPGGRSNPQEPPLATAKRELLEETGYEASFWIPLPSFYPFPSVADQKVHLFLARGLKKTSLPSLDPLEEISLKLLTLEDLATWDYATYPLDATLPIALFYYHNIKLKD